MECQYNETGNMIRTHVLVLNTAYFPIHVTSLKRAVCMMYQGIARAIDTQYRTFTFDHWLHDANHDDEVMGLVGRVMRIPRVVVLVAYDRMPKRGLRFSRRNILLRDQFKCQYCADRFSSAELNLDHVMPRCRGGRTSWENVVASCHHCNRRKGSRTPDEAGMPLVRKPYRPTAIPLLGFGERRIHHPQWQPFLDPVNHAHWSAEE